MSKLSNVPQSIGCIKARRRCCDAHGRRQTLLLCHITTHQTVRDAAVSKHETKSVTQQRGHGREWGLGKVPPPGTAAVSKHETGTVAKQTTGALQFMIDFAFGGGGLQHLREYVSLPCALGGGRSVPAKISTPLTYTIISKINQGGVFENPDGLQGGTVSTDCQDRVRSIHVQVVQRSPEHRLYQSTTQVLLRTRPPSNTAALSQHNTPDCKRISKHKTQHTSTDPNT